MAGLFLFSTRASMSLPVTKRYASFPVLEERPAGPMHRIAGRQADPNYALHGLRPARLRHDAGQREWLGIAPLGAGRYARTRRFISARPRARRARPRGRTCRRPSWQAAWSTGGGPRPRGG